MSNKTKATGDVIDAEFADDNEANESTAIAQRNEAVMQQHNPIGQDGFDLSQLEPAQQLEIVREIYDAEAQLEAMALPQYPSSEILGVEINVLDAAFKSITETVKGVSTEKVCVSFVCEFAEDCDKGHAGEQFTVLKSSNAFNDVYANRFTKLRGIMQRPLNGYEFVEDARYNKAGNNAIVLRRKVKASSARTK